MSQKTRRRILPVVLLALALVAGLATWAGTTTADPLECRGDCAAAAFVCTTYCIEEYRWNPTGFEICMDDCDAQQLACIQACDE